MKTPVPTVPSLHRRQFLHNSGLAVLGGTLAADSFASGAQVSKSPGDLLRIGLVGCGGRGTGAVAQALAADPNTRLVAMSDSSEDRIRTSLSTLENQSHLADRIDVPESRRFPGFSGYQQVIEHSDVVLLATPPHFRPIHLEAAIDAGKHVFAEKRGYPVISTWSNTCICSISAPGS